MTRMMLGCDGGAVGSAGKRERQKQKKMRAIRARGMEAGYSCAEEESTFLKLETRICLKDSPECFRPRYTRRVLDVKHLKDSLIWWLLVLVVRVHGAGTDFPAIY